MTEAAHSRSGSRHRNLDSWCPGESSCSERSINERDFLADVDYEWLCGYGCGPARAPQAYSPDLKGGPAPLADAQLYSELSYHVDATLAEVDMEEFYRGDINRILEISGYGGELYEEEKEQSSALFSSTKEQAVFNTISMDSLDCSSYEAENIARSCRTNMNNYTIAFEASMTSSSNDPSESSETRKGER
ncbi:uncharacterized protein LOC119110012 [Pollicipes pollicipes]|uniref:uncharacterized protein LOC119110012 n=1 Tax=Pollicipes pollicipes TaxID=41117 RepID=UPI001884AFE3|nr:uncharacterized protein LOC119110012 [Pollicipes pollicipes]